MERNKFNIKDIVRTKYLTDKNGNEFIQPIKTIVVNTIEKYIKYKLYNLPFWFYEDELESIGDDNNVKKGEKSKDNIKQY